MYPGVHAAQDPGKPAIVMADSGRTVTYGELDEHSAALASALHGLGLRKGDVVAMLSDNAAECFEIYWACMRSGLYITPVNRSLTADEVAYIVTDSEAKALIASAALAELAGKVRGMVAVEGALRVRRKDRGLRLLRGADRVSRSAAARAAARLGHDVFQWHHRPAEGRSPDDAAHPGRRAGRPDHGTARRRVQVWTRRRLPLSRLRSITPLR